MDLLGVLGQSSGNSSDSSGVPGGVSSTPTSSYYPPEMSQSSLGSQFPVSVPLGESLSQTLSRVDFFSCGFYLRAASSGNFSPRCCSPAQAGGSTQADVFFPESLRKGMEHFHWEAAEGIWEVLHLLYKFHPTAALPFCTPRVYTQTNSSGTISQCHADFLCSFGIKGL